MGAIYIALFAAVVAAAIAVPVENDLETTEEWGAIGNAIGGAANKFSSWLKGKECQLRQCSGCETKKKRSWGRRRLLSEESAEFWKTTSYTDCSVRNKCLAENAEAKKVAATHAATAAEMDKIKDLEGKEAAA